MHVCKYACMQVCKYASMHACKYASMHISKQVCKYAIIQVCNLRGGVTKKNGKIWEKLGGLKKTDKNSQFQFGNLKNPWGGLDFSKMSVL